MGVKLLSDKLLVMEGIDKSFPGVRALDHCRLELNAGEVLALVGENGAGKSTLMKILTGFCPPSAPGRASGCGSGPAGPWPSFRG